MNCNAGTILELPLLPIRLLLGLGSFKCYVTLFLEQFDTPTLSKH